MRKNSKAFVLITLVIIVLGIIMVFFPGVSRSVDYIAGTTAEISGTSISESDLRNALNDQGVSVADIMVSTKGVIIVNTMNTGDADKIEKAVEQLKSTYSDIKVDASGNRTAGKSLVKLLYTALPVVAVIAAGFVYMWFLIKANRALVLSLCALAAAALTAAISIIARVSMSYELMSAFILVSFIAVIEAVIFAYYIRSITHIKEGESVVQKALEESGPLMLSIVVSIAVIGLGMVIFTPAALKMYGAVLLIGAAASYFSLRMLAPSLIKEV